MTEPMELRVSRAVDGLKKALAKFDTYYELPDERILPPPASPAELEELVAALGHALPPSFGAFLRLHNGFPEIDGRSDILSTECIARVNTDGPGDARVNLARRLQGIQAGNIIVIGRAAGSASTIYLDITHPTGAGELTVVEFDEDKGLDGTHVDFVAFLEATAEGLNAAVDEEKGDWRDVLDPDI